MGLPRNQVWLLTAVFIICFFGILPFSHRYGCMADNQCPVVAGPPFVIAVLVTACMYLCCHVYNRQKQARD